MILVAISDKLNNKKTTKSGVTFDEDCVMFDAQDHKYHDTDCCTNRGDAYGVLCKKGT